MDQGQDLDGAPSYDRARELCALKRRSCAYAYPRPRSDGLPANFLRSAACLLFIVRRFASRRELGNGEGGADGPEKRNSVC
jgi:hypothetical protein